MTYLWDTDICIYFLNGDKEIARKIERVGSGEIGTTAITLAELSFGAHKSARKDDNLRRVADFASTFAVYDCITRQISDTFGRIKAVLQKQGVVVGDYDLLIASFAIVNDLILVTNNTDHYIAIPGLAIENWVEKRP